MPTLEGVDSAVACQRAAGQPLPAAAGSAPQPATWQTVFTAMFLHGSFLHIFGNMLFLAIFGPTVEDSMAGAGASSPSTCSAASSPSAPRCSSNPDSAVPTLGASGAIAAVLGGYVLLYPRARVLSLVFIVFFVTIVEVPAVVLLGFWFLVQLFFGAAGLRQPGRGGEGVAYFAHVGGFASACWHPAVRRRP